MAISNRDLSFGVLVVLTILGGAQTLRADTATWTGAVNNDWNNAGNWNTVPDPNAVPCNNGRTFDVIIDGSSATVTLDITCTVDSLQLLSDATLNVEGGVTLTVLSSLSDALTIGGALNVVGNVTVDVPTGSVRIQPGGIYQPAGTAVIGESSALNAASATVVGGPADSGVLGGQLLLDFAMTLHVTGDLLLDGTGMSSFRSAAALGGTTPPVLKVQADATGDVDGSTDISGVGEIIVESSETARGNALFGASGGVPTAELRIGGDFINDSTRPDLFSVGTGRIVLDGTSPQTFEVGGIIVDYNDPALSFQNNFAIGTLEIASGADVEFRDDFVNVLGSTQESLFIGNLALPAGSSLTANDSGVLFTAATVTGGAFSSAGSGQFRNTDYLPVPGATDWAVIQLALLVLIVGTLLAGRRASAMRSRLSGSSRP
jgi:hypothetical protein